VYRSFQDISDFRAEVERLEKADKNSSNEK